MNILIFILCMIAWGSIGIFVRFIPLPSLTIAFLRAIIASPILFVFYKTTKQQIINQKNLKALIRNGILIAINWILLFEAYRYTSIANATIAYNMAPIFMILISKYLYKQHVTTKEMWGCLLAFIGLILIVTSNFNIGSTHLIGISLGILGGVLYAFIVSSNRQIKAVSYQALTFIQIFTSAIILLPLVAFNNLNSLITLSAIQWGAIILLGVLQTAICYLVYYLVLPKIRIGLVSILSYFDPLSAILFGFVIFNEQLGYLQIIGIFIILVAPIWSHSSSTS